MNPSFIRSNVTSLRGNLDRSGGIFIGVIVGASMILGIGVNLILVYSGVQKGNSFKTDAVVLRCETPRTCVMQYDYEGQKREATYSSPSNLSDGQTVRITIYRNHLETAYSEKVVSLPLAIVLVTVGTAMLVFGSIKLFRHWRSERLAEEAKKSPIDLTKDEN